MYDPNSPAFFPGGGGSTSTSSVSGLCTEASPFVYGGGGTFASGGAGVVNSMGREFHVGDEEGDVDEGWCPYPPLFLDMTPVSALTFDSRRELLWAGAESGRLISYTLPEQELYTTFLPSEHPLDLLRCIDDSRMLAISKDTLLVLTGGGYASMTFRNDKYSMLLSAELTDGMHHAYVGDHVSSCLVVDLETSRVIMESPSSGGIPCMSSQDGILHCGTTLGELVVRDSRTLRVQKSIKAHSAVAQLSVQGHYVASCGYVSDSQGNLQQDPFVKVFDMRNSQMLSSFKVHSGVAGLAFHPNTSEFPSTLVTLSVMGILEYRDVSNSFGGNIPSFMYPIDTAQQAITSFALSPSGDLMAYGTVGGYLQVVATTPDSTATFEGVPACFPEEAPLATEPIPFEEWHTFAPPAKASGKGWASDWPSDPEVPFRVGRVAPVIKPNILERLHYRANVGYLSQKLERHELGYVQSKREGRKKVLSRLLDPSSDNSPWKEKAEAFRVPKVYCRVEKVEDPNSWAEFNFRKYNKTSFCGLENDLPNSYVNALLQVLFFVPQYSNFLLSYICPKEREFCLASETGFLYHMLRKFKGGVAQAKNFLRVFRQIREAAALGLFEETHALHPVEGDLIHSKIQKMMRFTLEHIHKLLHEDLQELEKNEAYFQMHLKSNKTRNKKKAARAMSSDPQSPGEGNSSDPGTPAEDSNGGGGGGNGGASTSSTSSQKRKTVIEEIFGSMSETQNRCLVCGNVLCRSDRTFCVDWTLSQDKDSRKPSFLTMIGNSFARETKTRTRCEQCGDYQPCVSNKLVVEAPNVLIVNCKEIGEKICSGALHMDEEDRKLPTRFWMDSSEAQQRGVRVLASPDVEVVRGQSTTSQESVGEAETEGELTTNKDSEEGSDTEVATGEESVKDKESFQDTTSPPLLTEYELSAVIIHVKHAEQEEGHLAALIKVPELFIELDADGKRLLHSPTHFTRGRPSSTGGSSEDRWYLFNDFLIFPEEEESVVNFSFPWKIPCVLMYSKVGYFEEANANPPTLEIPPTVFADLGLNSGYRVTPSFQRLHETERIYPGMKVALDAEFVALTKEESREMPDGTRRVVTPPILALARVSVIRGEGPLEGVPFIDDYIRTPEPVQDFLTRFSGLQHGDLDPNMSSHFVTSLKSAYLKLRYLVDHGVIFVGHGLSKDFKIINIFVPQSQIIDTVQLFRFKGQRMMSLRFLAYHVLKESIQEHIHDSIEDARTALKLFRRYEFIHQRQGPVAFDDFLEKLYHVGRTTKWQLPGSM